MEMVRCPQHPEVTLRKTMVNAQQLNGVWFPGFYCPKYLETYTYVDILMHKYGLSREEAEARKRYEAERIAAAAGVSPLWTMSTEEFRGMLRELIREELRRLGFRV